MTEQHIRSGAHSTNVQSEVAHFHSGVSPVEALEMMEEVSRRNLERYAERVQYVIDERVAVILPKIVDELNARGTLESVADPGMQYATLNVQRDYARTGDDDLGETLVQLLADRSQSESRSRLQVVLDESLQVVARLTQQQMDALSLVLLVRRPRPTVLIVDHPTFREHLERQILPWFPVAADELDIYHLSYTGCASIAAGGCTMASAFWQVWPGLWQKGLEEDRIPEGLRGHLGDSSLFHPSLHDPTKPQVNATNKPVARLLAGQRGVDGDEFANLLDAAHLSESEINDFTGGLLPGWVECIAEWDGSQLKHLELTPVGIAIGHANARRRLGSAVIGTLAAYGV